MIAARVRVVSITQREVLAFVVIGDEHETRVRFLPGRYRCDACGERAWPTCKHSRAIVTSPTYEMERTRNDK